jgi:hypothetical protein
MAPSLGGQHRGYRMVPRANVLPKIAMVLAARLIAPCASRSADGSWMSSNTCGDMNRPREWPTSSVMLASGKQKQDGWKQREEEVVRQLSRYHQHIIVGDFAPRTTHKSSPQERYRVGRKTAKCKR